MSIEAKLQEFSRVAADPKGQLNAFKAEGKKVVGVLPYYAPEELVYAAGLVPRVLRNFLLHHRTAGSGNAAGRHHGSAGRHHHPYHLRYSAPHEPELPRGNGR